MKHFVYIKDLLGVKTNADKFGWIYGSVAPRVSESEFEKCKIKINLHISKTADVFDKWLRIEEYDRYNYFFAKANEKKIYYDRKFIFNSRIRYSIEIRGNDITVIVNKNYFKYIKYRFMNLHSLGYILSDLTSGLLLENGYATLHCSAVNIGERSLTIFAPPGTGKTLTAIKLCENADAKFISEDIGVTDGEYIHSVPWTSTFRYYNHEKESKLDRFMDLLYKNIPILELLSMEDQKSIKTYLTNNSFADVSKITDVIILGKGERKVIEGKDGFIESILNLNKYEFNYHRSPMMLVMNYFNPDFSIDNMYEWEKYILSSLIKKTNCYRIYAQNPIDYHKEIIEKVLR